MDRELALAWDRARIREPVRVSWVAPSAEPVRAMRKARQAASDRAYGGKGRRRRRKWTEVGVPSPALLARLEVLARTLGYPVPVPRDRRVAEALAAEWGRQVQERYARNAARDRPGARAAMRTVIGKPVRAGVRVPREELR